MNEHTVLIGGIGTSHYNSSCEALMAFIEYMELSSEPDSYVAGEKITLKCGEKILDVYYPLNYEEWDDELDAPILRPDRSLKIN